MTGNGGIMTHSAVGILRAFTAEHAEDDGSDNCGSGRGCCESGGGAGAGVALSCCTLRLLTLSSVVLNFSAGCGSSLGSLATQLRSRL